MGMSCAYGVCWQVCDVLMYFYRVCWKPFMGMWYFLVQTCTRVTKVSYFSVQFCSQLSPISCFVCVFCIFFVHTFVILCLCVAVCGRQFLSRVDILFQFYGVFWELLMGMSCFLVQQWVRAIKVSCFSVHVCPQLSLIPCFVCICLHILHIFVWFCAYALQSVAGSSWVELLS